MLKMWLTQILVDLFYLGLWDFSAFLDHVYAVKVITRYTLNFEFLFDTHLNST